MQQSLLPRYIKRIPDRSTQYSLASSSWPRAPRSTSSRSTWPRREPYALERSLATARASATADKSSPARLTGQRLARRTTARLDGRFPGKARHIVQRLDLFPAGSRPVPARPRSPSTACRHITDQHQHPLRAARRPQDRRRVAAGPAPTTPSVYHHGRRSSPAERGGLIQRRLAVSGRAELRLDQSSRSPTSRPQHHDDCQRIIVADRVVICADASTEQVLAGLDVRLPLEPTLEQQLLRSAAPAARPRRLPLSISIDDPSLLRFPCSPSRPSRPPGLQRPMIDACRPTVADLERILRRFARRAGHRNGLGAGVR